MIATNIIAIAVFLFLNIIFIPKLRIDEERYELVIYKMGYDKKTRMTLFLALLFSCIMPFGLSIVIELMGKFDGLFIPIVLFVCGVVNTVLYFVLYFVYLTVFISLEGEEIKINGLKTKVFSVYDIAKVKVLNNMSYFYNSDDKVVFSCAYHNKTQELIDSVIRYHSIEIIK